MAGPASQNYLAAFNGRLTFEACRRLTILFVAVFGVNIK
jgi:hypothetical protein